MHTLECCLKVCRLVQWVISYHHYQNLPLCIFPKTSNWSGTIFFRFLQQIGSSFPFPGESWPAGRWPGGPDLLQLTFNRVNLILLKGRSDLLLQFRQKNDRCCSYKMIFAATRKSCLNYILYIFEASFDYLSNLRNFKQKNF